MTATRDTSQSCTGSTSGTSVTATYPATATVSKLLVAGVFVEDDASTIGTPSTWTRINAVTHGSGTFSMVLFSKIALGTETNIVVSKSGGAAGMNVAAYQYSGIVTASPNDVSAVATDGNVQVNSLATGTTGTTAQADELIITLMHLNGAQSSFTWTNAGAPITSMSSNSIFVGERTVNAVSTYSDTGSWTSNFYAIGLIATFKAAAVATDVYWTSA